MPPSSSSSQIPFKPRHPLPHLSSQTLLAFTTPQILLVTLNRPASLNCISTSQHHELASIWDWMDNEPSIRCGIITGAGDRAFCAGADLKGTGVLVRPPLFTFQSLAYKNLTHQANLLHPISRMEREQQHRQAALPAPLRFWWPLQSFPR